MVGPSNSKYWNYCTKCRLFSNFHVVVLVVSVVLVESSVKKNNHALPKQPPSSTPIIGVEKVRSTPSTAGNSMTGSERPSPEPLLEKEAPPAVLGGEMLWSLQMP